MIHLLTISTPWRKEVVDILNTYSLMIVGIEGVGVVDFVDEVDVRLAEDETGLNMNVETTELMLKLMLELAGLFL